MSKDRVIHLLTDEDVSYIMTGLRLAIRKYMDMGCDDDVLFIRQLYDKIEFCEDIGVINDEKI